MTVLGLDVGSSSVKAAILRNGRIVGEPSRASYKTRYDGSKVEVDPPVLLRAIAKAIEDLGAKVRHVDAIGLSVMSPAWVAMDKHGKPLTPLVTHQDRRSVEIATEIERRVGKQRHLRTAGNRPFPGGISSTTFAWFRENEPARMKRADLVGHLNTFLHRQLTGRRVIDPSNASFTGLWRTGAMRGWSEMLCKAVGCPMSLLPEVIEANRIAGELTPEAARQFGLTTGTPMAAGMVDTSAAMLSTGARPGQLFNMCGSTDVLGLSMDRFRPHERLLTRALGVGKKWMSVSTLAAAGSSLVWIQEQMFGDLSEQQFRALTKKLAAARKSSTVVFEPYLAGERASIEQRHGAFRGLTLSTTRDEMLAAVIHALAQASAARLPLLQQEGVKMLRTVALSGGGAGLSDLLHRDWPGHWRFKMTREASLCGLASIPLV